MAVDDGCDNTFINDGLAGQSEHGSFLLLICHPTFGTPPDYCCCGTCYGNGGLTCCTPVRWVAGLRETVSTGSRCLVLSVSAEAQRCSHALGSPVVVLYMHLFLWCFSYTAPFGALAHSQEVCWTSGLSVIALSSFLRLFVSVVLSPPVPVRLLGVRQADVEQKGQQWGGWTAGETSVVF